MLPFGVTIQATVPQRAEIPEGLMNYAVYEVTQSKNDKVNLIGTLLGHKNYTLVESVS
jgi:hypothetical protein